MTPAKVERSRYPESTPSPTHQQAYIADIADVANVFFSNLFHRKESLFPSFFLLFSLIGDDEDLDLSLIFVLEKFVNRFNDF